MTTREQKPEADKQIVLKHIAIEVKDEEKGEVEAIVATLNVVDRDGDVIRPGAFKAGSKVQMSQYGHGSVFGAKPVGKGTLSEEGNKLVFKGRIFLKMRDGVDTLEMLKGMGPDSEWSFGFFTTGWEAPSDTERKSGARRIVTKGEAAEVSPVFRGAGVGTRTVSVKSEDGGGAREDLEAPDPAPAAGPTPAELEAKAKLEREQLEAKAAADRAAYVKARDDAMEHFHQVQRNLKRVGYVR